MFKVQALKNSINMEIKKLLLFCFLIVNDWLRENKKTVEGSKGFLNCDLSLKKWWNRLKSVTNGKLEVLVKSFVSLHFKTQLD